MLVALDGFPGRVGREFTAETQRRRGAERERNELAIANLVPGSVMDLGTGFAPFLVRY